MKSVLLPFIFLLNIIAATAMIDPYYKEAMQRGYRVTKGDSVELPDGSICSLHDFNNKLCGKEYFDQPYCVQEGVYVWDENVCCEDLVPYLPKGVDGQAICKARGKVDFSVVLRNPLLWLGVLGINAVVYVSLVVVKRLRQNRS
jgi:hypothetical protein